MDRAGGETGDAGRFRGRSGSRPTAVARFDGSDGRLRRGRLRRDGPRGSGRRAGRVGAFAGQTAPRIRRGSGPHGVNPPAMPTISRSQDSVEPGSSDEDAAGLPRAASRRATPLRRTRCAPRGVAERGGMFDNEDGADSLEPTSAAGSHPDGAGTALVGSPGLRKPVVRCESEHDRAQDQSRFRGTRVDRALRPRGRAARAQPAAVSLRPDQRAEVPQAAGRGST